MVFSNTKLNNVLGGLDDIGKKIRSDDHVLYFLFKISVFICFEFQLHLIHFIPDLAYFLGYGKHLVNVC